MTHIHDSDSTEERQREWRRLARRQNKLDAQAVQNQQEAASRKRRQIKRGSNHPSR